MKLYWAFVSVWAALLLLGLTGCPSNPTPPPPTPSQYLVRWVDPNTVPTCKTPPVYPCDLNQTFTGPATAVVPAGTTQYTITALSATTYQLVIYAYSPAGVLTASKPVTVTIP